MIRIPNSPTHAILGVLAFLSVAFFLKVSDPFLLSVGFVLALLASEIPDIDMASSHIAELIFTLIALVGLGGIAYWHYQHQEIGVWVAGACFVFLILLWQLKHRGITHSVQALLVTSVPLWFLNPVFAGFWGIGYATHLVADSVTSNGKGKYL